MCMYVYVRGLVQQFNKAADIVIDRLSRFVSRRSEERSAVMSWGEKLRVMR